MAKMLKKNYGEGVHTTPLGASLQMLTRLPPPPSYYFIIRPLIIKSKISRKKQELELEFASFRAYTML